MKNGSLTLVGVIFLSIISLIIGYQLAIYQNYQKINGNLINEYELKIQMVKHHSKKD